MILRTVAVSCSNSLTKTRMRGEPLVVEALEGHERPTPGRRLGPVPAGGETARGRFQTAASGLCPLLAAANRGGKK